MVIHMELNPSSIENAIQQLESYRDGLNRKAQMLCEQLASMGAMYAEWNFSGVLYAGDIDYHVEVEERGENVYAIKASGRTVMLLEFGAGVRHGYGHPLASEFGMGPGTYPGQKHAFDPNGWWFRQGGTKIHTYGNAPGMAMYNAAKDLRSEILKVAQEVFKS